MTIASWIIIGIGALVAVLIVLKREVAIEHDTRQARENRIRRMQSTKFPPGRRRRAF